MSVLYKKNSKKTMLDYNQPPYTEVLMPNELLATYGEGVIFASGLIVDAEKAFGNLWIACDTYLGNGEHIFSSLEDAETFLNEHNKLLSINPNNITHQEYINLVNQQYSLNLELLTKIGYSEDFAEVLLDNDIELPLNEIQKYLDKEMFGKIPHLSEKRDILRRFKKFSDKYFDGDEIQMLHALKHVQLYHEWCDITKNYIPINWKNIHWKNVLLNANELSAGSCNGGACEITKL
jgi:hypothetical protein